MKTGRYPGCKPAYSKTGQGTAFTERKYTMNEACMCPQTSTAWVGLDVSKASFDAALVCPDQHWPATPLAAIPVRAFARTPAGVADLVRWLETRGQTPESTGAARVVMEATGRYSSELAEWMLDQCPELSPAIAPPHQTAAFIRSLGLRNKTDQLEARALAFYGRERQPVPYEPLTPQDAELRELSRYRDALVRERVAAGNRAQETCASRAVAALQRKRLRLLDADIERIEQEMRRCVAENLALQRDVELLSTIYGVAFITAVTVRLELGDLRRFRKARQLTAYAGLNPSVRQSGTSVRGRAHLGKQGNPRVRQCLYLAAMVVIRGNNDLQRFYLHLRQQGKGAMAALGAVMRKLLVLMRAILISGQPYDPLLKTCSHKAIQP